MVASRNGREGLELDRVSRWVRAARRLNTSPSCRGRLKMFRLEMRSGVSKWGGPISHGLEGAAK
eukprot:7375333-Prymnesium_polylepis.1